MNGSHKAIISLTLAFLSGCSPYSLTRPQLFSGADIVGKLLPEHTQAIVVLPDDHDPQRAYLMAWEREGEWWSQKFSAMPAVIGRNGLAAPGEKKEGDGKTPSGTFELKRAFGYAPEVKTGLSYRQVSDYDYWSDDPASAQYNLWVQGTPPLGSYEALRRPDGLYSFAVVIEYNTEPVVPGKGSAIFLHVWRGKKAATAGCVATSAGNVKKLLKWLDGARNPVIILNHLGI
jgi:L,D-peptidoglycan transpeptidase YkuD (ErfK/YbiS/YcfS/YnhG family)